MSGSRIIWIVAAGAHTFSKVQPRHAVVELWSRNTVRRYLREGEAAAVHKPAPKRAEKLDPFKAYIVDRVKAAAPDRIPAIVLFREIKARGHDGGEGDLASGMWWGRRPWAWNWRFDARCRAGS